MRILRGDAKRWGDGWLSCLGDDHPAVKRQAAVNGRKANFATMKRRWRSRSGSGEKERPSRRDRGLDDVPGLGEHHGCGRTGSSGNSGCVGHGVYAPLLGRGSGKIRCDLTSQLPRGDQLERGIALLFSAMLAPNSALISFAQVLNGAIRWVHAKDARSPEGKAINLAGCMIGASSSAVATHESERDEYPGGKVGVGKAENFWRGATGTRLRISRACYLVRGANKILEEARRAEPTRANLQQR